MNKETMLKNRAFDEVYEVVSDVGIFKKGEVVGRVNRFAWRPLEGDSSIAVGQYSAFDETLFSSKHFVKLRGKIDSPRERERWWQDEKPKARKPYTFSKKFNKTAPFTS